METRLRVDTHDSRPLWRQIEEGLEQLVGVGAMGPGEGVPSVRELAKELRVNPATVAKAFQKLVDRGVLETRRGDGTYVAERAPDLGAEARRARLVEAAGRLATVAGTLGASDAESHAALEEALTELRSSSASDEKKRRDE